jgi:hypothetical protein
MKNLLMRYKLAFIVLFGAVSANADEINYVSIKTIDENNQPIQAEIIKWCFSDTPHKKKILECKRANCSEWLIQKEKPQAIDIYAFASKIKKDDPYCWDLFKGEAKNQASQKEIEVTLTYSSTVCK